MTTKSKAAKTNTATTKTPAAKSPKKTVRTETTKLAPRIAAQPKSKSQSAPLRENSKLASVIELLRRKEGATIEQLMKATGWQSHSVRGALSGALKKKLGLKVTSVKTHDVRTYRIAGRA
jgi:hypothetical protein